jgi:hypothetical protein
LASITGVVGRRNWQALQAELAAEELVLYRQDHIIHSELI